MRIKHYAGYGYVNAVKKGRITEHDGKKHIRIEVTGNHEVGLTRPFHDDYLIRTWLLERFDRTVKDMSARDLKVKYKCEDGYRKIDGLDVEYAIYDIVYGERDSFGWEA